MSLFDDIAEPRSLVLVVDWKIGQTDFPAGSVVTRDKQVSPAVLLDIVAQLGKMNARVMHIYHDTLAQMDEINTTMDEQIASKQALVQELIVRAVELEHDINELEQRKDALKGNTPA
jgi:uncharacterized protein YceH (UPF0502 family)